MKEIITIINQKGGVGKSTTANALGAGLHKRGYKVLYIDLDAQGNLSYSLKATGKDFTSLEVLTGKITVSKVIINTNQGDIIPASPLLANADTLITETGKEYKLNEAIEPIKNNYDYIIIDTPPSLGILTINALATSNSVIIPVQADIYSLQGIGQFIQTMNAVKKYCNKDLSIKGILATRYNKRANLTKDMTELLEDTAKSLNTKVFNTKIRECISIKEAQTVREDIYSYNPKSNASKDYSSFIDELLEME